MARWWTSLSRGEKAAIAAATGLGIAGGIALASRKATASSKLGRLFPGWTWLHPAFDNLADFDGEESDEPEPEGIVYDEDDAGPCRSPAIPWNVPVSSPGLGGKVSEEFCVPPADLEPIAQTDVPFAEGGLRPKWPLKTNDPHKLKVSYQDVRELFHGRWGRHFGSSRSSTAEDGHTYKRVHVGVDLFADPGDVVLAPEDGVVIATLPFYRGTGAVYLKADSGVVINLGEIEEGSWRKFGIGSGDLSKKGGHRVVAGQPVARVGKSNDGSHMLHLETYASDATVDEIRQKKMRWIAGEDAPAKVLDPTRYLVRAQRVYYEDKDA